MSRKRKTPSPGRPAVAPAPVVESPAGGWLGTAACAAVVLLAFVFGFHKVDDFDTWWHLAAGRWIATHHTIPATDTLSHTVRDHAWINLQWGFDLGLYFLHRTGGAVLLSVAGALAFSLATALLLAVVVRHLGSRLGALVVLLVVLAAQERVTLRPELMSFLLLAALLLILDHGRRPDGRGLFLLIPLMIVWANVHALFVVGAFAIVCAFVGPAAARSRRLLICGALALASTALNPFLFKGVLFPLTLMSRLDGSSAVFQTVGEFASPFAADATGLSLVFYKVLLALGSVAAVMALVRRPGQFDWGGLILFAGLAALSATARRNIPLFALGSAPFIAGCLESVLGSLPRLREVTTRRAALVSVTVLAATSLTAMTVVTGSWYKRDNSPQEFGAGVIEGAFPERAAAFARAAALPGKLYNDMAAGGYLAWDDPIGDGVFIDGRLEVYDTAFLTASAMAITDPVRWQADADRYGIQTAIIFHRFETERTLTGRLFESKLWSLVYADEVAAVFVRTQGNEAVLAHAASIRAEWDAKTDAWLSRPIASWRYPAGRIEGTRAYARFMSTIGRAEPAIAAYLKLFELGISRSEEVMRRLLVARYFASTGRTSEAREQARRVLALDPQNTEAARLLR